MRSSLSLASAALLTVAVCACGGNPAGTDPSLTTPTSAGGGAGSGGSGSAAGMLTIHLTDSPFSDARALLVTFSEVSVHRADPGEWKTLPFAAGTSRTCDLKKLNGATDVLGVGPLAAGKYTQIRLTVASADLYFDSASVGGPCAPQIPKPAGASAPLDIPSGEVNLNKEFFLAGTGTTILLDFDGDQSVRQTGSGNGKNPGNANSKYMMSPVIRVVSVQ